MLILSRAKNEQIVINTPEGVKINVVVIEISDQRVRIGFIAPKDTIIDRLEIANKKAAVLTAILQGGSRLGGSTTSTSEIRLDELEQSEKDQECRRSAVEDRTSSDSILMDN